MTDPQTWTLIGGFIALTAAMNGLVLRVVQAEIRALGYRFDGVDAKIDGLDRDVSMLVRRTIEDK